MLWFFDRWTYIVYIALIIHVTILTCVKYIMICIVCSGVPAVVDFAAMRDAMKKLGGDPSRINPVCPADLVIDHSVQVLRGEPCNCVMMIACRLISIAPKML